MMASPVQRAARGSMVQSVRLIGIGSSDMSSESKYR